MIANEVVPEARTSATVVNGEGEDEYDATRKTVAEDVSEALECEAIFLESVEVNGSPAGVMLDGTVTLANYEPVISTPEGRIVHADNDA